VLGGGVRTQRVPAQLSRTSLGGTKALERIWSVAFPSQVNDVFTSALQEKGKAIGLGTEHVLFSVDGHQMAFACEGRDEVDTFHFR
jgi:hypothetical protein